MSLMENTRLLWFAQAGDKKRESTIYKFLTKGYDASFEKVNGQVVFNENHLVQTTELKQPRLRGNIAPGGVLCAYNGFGEGRYFPHTPIAFTADDPWSVSLAFNFDGSNTTTYVCGNGDAANLISVQSGSAPVIMIEMDNNVFTFNNISSAGLIGKNSILTVTYDCVNLSVYINGIFQESKPAYHSFVLSQLFDGYSLRSFKGSIFYYRPQSGAMTAQQVAEETAMIRSWLPEMLSVAIGNQVWATSNLDITCTPMGNLIKEMQLDQNTDMALNGSFDNDVSSFSTSRCSITWNPLGYLEAVGTEALNNFAILQSAHKVGVWYQIKFKAKSPNITYKPYVSVAHYSQIILKTQPDLSPEWQSYEFIAKPVGISFVLYGCAQSVPAGSQIDFDDIEIIEIGWAGLGDLYSWLTIDGGYSQDNALKEVAAWCYYNNDPDNGAVYGKLYNWYAAKLLQNDIDAYNLVNPTSHWGWHIPTENEVNTLIAALGGTLVAGGKIKMTGTDHWNAPNTGADNQSEFTMLGGGVRLQTGTFTSINIYGRIWTLNSYSETDAKAMRLSYSDSELTIANELKLRGFSTRLIKD